MTTPTQKPTKRAWITWEHLPSFVVGFFAVLITVIFTFSPHDLSVTSLANTWPQPWIQYGWLAILGVGGIAALIGVLGRRARLEGAGLSLIGAAYIIDFWAILDNRALAGLLSGGLIFAAGVSMWFYAFVIFPKRDYPDDSYAESDKRR